MHNQSTYVRDRTALVAVNAAPSRFTPGVAAMLVGVALIATRPVQSQVIRRGWATATAISSGASADTSAVASSLDSLIALAQTTNPAINAAASRIVAAHAAVGPAGARPDPMLMAGIQNLPTDRPGFGGEMAMNMVGISQTFPYPGKLSLATRAAEEDEASARAALAQRRLDVERDVRDAYYELAFVRRARDIVQRNAEVLGSLARITEAQYSAGNSAQADVLRARVEVARLGDEAASLDAQERSVLANLNAVLNRPSDTPVGAAVIPHNITRLAVADSGVHVHFVSSALGAAASNSPLLPIDSLDALALAHSPMLLAYRASISAQERRLELTRKAYLPDFDVSLQYGQRPQFSDLVSLTVSVPVRLQRGRKQNQDVVAASARLSELDADRAAQINSIRQEIATRVSDVERERTQLALSLKAVLPQARATFASATASYQVGRVDFSSLVDAQAAVFNFETAYWRSLADFAKSIAELQRTVGARVLR